MKIKPDLVLYRVNYSVQGCQGLLSVPIPGGDPFKGMANAFAVTLERDWAWNKPFISCIPKGLYKIEKINSPKFGWTYILVNVEGRTLIEIHPGTTVKNTEGCILVGENFTTVSQLKGGDSDQLAIGDSRAAHAEMMRILDDKNEAYLLIIGNTLIETDLILKGIDIKLRQQLKKGDEDFIELPWTTRLMDLTTKTLISVNKGISQFNRDREMTAPPKWKKILKFVFDAVQFLLSLWVGKNGIKFLDL